MQNKEQMRRARLREISGEITKEGQALSDCCGVGADGESAQAEMRAHAERIVTLAERLKQMLWEETGTAGAASLWQAPELAGQKFFPMAGGMPLVNETTIDDIRVLLLDDNELTRSYHMSMLYRLGVPCAYAANGADALCEMKRARLSENEYDVCIVNWNMPGIVAVIQQIRSFHAGAGIVIAGTTGERETQEAQMLASGVDYILEKPVYQTALYQFLTGICRNIQ